MKKEALILLIMITFTLVGCSDDPLRPPRTAQSFDNFSLSICQRNEDPSPVNPNPGSCSFRYSREFAAPYGKTCRISYRAPGQNNIVSVTYYTDCDECLTPALDSLNEAGGPISQSSGLSCNGADLAGLSNTEDSFILEMLDAQTCLAPQELFHFDSADCSVL